MLPRSKRQRLSRPARLVQEVSLFAWQGLSEFGKKPKGPIAAVETSLGDIGQLLEAAYARLTQALPLHRKGQVEGNTAKTRTSFADRGPWGYVFCSR